MNTDLNTAVSSVASSYQTTPAKQTKESESAVEDTVTKAAEKGTEFGEAAVYEKSSGDTDKITATRSNGTDRTALVNQLKADAQKQQDQLMEIVRKTMEGQGKTLAKADDMWRFLADGNFTVDPATKAQAQADIADDGYWGVEQTSDRIVDFAKALSDSDPKMADKMMDAFKKGFEEATKTWGKDLPDLSKRTYDAVLQKFDDWKNSSSTTEEAASQTNDQAAQVNAASEVTA